MAAIAGLVALSIGMGLTASQMLRAQDEGAQVEMETEIGNIPDLLEARVTTTAERARLVIDLAAPTEFAVFTVTEPNRVIVELRAVLPEEPDDFSSLAGEGLVSEYAVTSSASDRVRAQLHIADPAQVQQSYILDAFEDQPARLVIDLVPDTLENFMANARSLADEAEGQDTMPVAELDGQEMAPGETATADSTIRPLVIIDPGHGGVDSGARSENGLEEKNIVLAFGLKLQHLLAETGKFDVALTRDGDVFLPLGERLALARANQADLFISLHADSFDQEDVRGASIYTRGNIATDMVERVLGDDEELTDLIAGYDVPEDDAVVGVLVDLLDRETRRKSFKAARALVEQLEPSIQLRPYPQRQADFFVLNSPDVPSVLIELGFLSNTDDSANLTTDAWLDRVAAAMARGVAVYFEDQGVLSVAQE